MTVYLVGAGPGDPGLLTRRGAELLARADVVLYDRLSVASLLDLAPAEAERISVGKTPRGSSTPQDEINRLLVEHGLSGREVVRLKGGDPFVFARGGEEALALAAAGVPFEVVPGISAAIAAPAYAGVPVTHRGVSTSFTVVTGHEDPWASSGTDWDAVARIGGTIVVMMGVATRGEIARRLIAGGRDPATPVMAVWWGTRPEQRSLRTVLASLGEAPVGTTATIVIGEVAALDLAWFERRPLFGRTVVVTRAAHQAGSLSRRLRSLGAEVVEVPTIRIVPPTDGGRGLADAAARLGSFDWVALTSANAVSALFEHVWDARALAGCRVAAIGPGTGEALARHGVRADLVPERSVAEGLLGDLAASPPGRVLVPQARSARPVLVAGLRKAGWDVEVAEAYGTEPADVAPAVVTAAAQADAIAFTSASTVAGFVRAAGRDACPACVISIGPTTSSAAIELGLSVTREADPHTLDGLVTALQEALTS